MDLVGKIYGRLLVLARAGKTKHRNLTWSCRCLCLNLVVVSGGNLRSGHTTSCGCVAQESRLSLDTKAKKHGHVSNKTGSLTYQSWRCARERCTNPSNASYRFYGAKGIKVCQRWDDFKLFLLDMGERPGKDFNLDRINPFEDYTPENCRWQHNRDMKKNTRRKHGKLQQIEG